MPNGGDTRSATDGQGGGGGVMVRVAHYALVTGLLGMIPIPFADELAQNQAKRRMVEALFARRGQRVEVGDVKPLWAGPSRSVLSKAGSLTRGLMMKPVKKGMRTILLPLKFRRALLDAGETLLLGHTIDRLLADGWFRQGQAPAALREESMRVTKAVRASWAGADRRGVMLALRKSGRVLRGWRGSGKGPARGAKNLDELKASMSDKHRDLLGRAADDLDRRLRAEEGRSMLARFDAAVDARLGPS